MGTSGVVGIGVDGVVRVAGTVVVGIGVDGVSRVAGTVGGIGVDGVVRVAGTNEGVSGVEAVVIIGAKDWPREPARHIKAEPVSSSICWRCAF